MCSSSEERHLTEADYKAAQLHLESYINEHHESIYWYLRSSCHAKKELADDAMQNLWLYVFRQILFQRADKMYRSFLYNKAKWILLDLQSKLGREDPFDLSSIDLRGKDELEKHEHAAMEAMYEQSVDAKSPEPSNVEEEAALFKKFWERFPNVNVTDQQKVIAFDIYRFGLTLKEASDKHGVAISTLSDWMGKVKHELEVAHYNEEDAS